MNDLSKSAIQVKKCKYCGSPLGKFKQTLCDKTECKNKNHTERQKKYLKTNPGIMVGIRKKYRDNNIIKCIDRVNQWRKDNPKKNRESAKKTRDKYLKEHPEEGIVKLEKWKKEHPERIKLKNYLNVLRRRARMKSGMDIKIDYDALIQKSKMFFGCCYCGDEGKLQIDHLKPISKGGYNNKQNLFMACGRCNSSKNAKDWKDWYRKQKFYNLEREKLIEHLSISDVTRGVMKCK